MKIKALGLLLLGMLVASLMSLPEAFAAKRERSSDRRVDRSMDRKTDRRVDRKQDRRPTESGDRRAERHLDRREDRRGDRKDEHRGKGHEMKNKKPGQNLSDEEKARAKAMGSENKGERHGLYNELNTDGTKGLSKEELKAGKDDIKTLYGENSAERKDFASDVRNDAPAPAPTPSPADVPAQQNQ